MRLLWAGMVLLSFVAPAVADDHIALRVLYCGDPGSAREADYRAFLEQHFTQVTLHDFRTFKEDDANGHDVVIFDWTYEYDGKGSIDPEKMRRWKRPKVSRDFARPAILVGQAGGVVANPLELKVNWLCLCLNGPAHHLRLEHPLFHAPLEVAPQLEQMPTPENYPYLTLDKKLGPTMTVWKVQTKNPPEIDPGLVSGLYGFTDSPDAEVFAQGIAGKGPDTVPLGRHANYLLWGFSAPPTDMTPAGQRLFVNAVCYIHKFDGQRPLVRNEARSREWALVIAGLPRFLSQDYKEHEIRRRRALFEKHPEWVPGAYKGNVDAFLNKTTADLQAAYAQSIDRALPTSLRQQFGLNADRYEAYYRENLEYLHPVGGRHGTFDVDEEAKAVGPSNRRVEFLDRCLQMLEKKDKPDRALRLLKRYTNESIENAAEWRKWLDQNRSRLFFSDVGGYKFFVGPEKPTAEAAAGEAIKR
jgi:hypothetical protein